MARYKAYDLNQAKMIPLSYADQIVEGSFEYALNEMHTFRAGVNYGANPVPDDKINPLFPAIPELHMTLGYGLTMGSWGVDLAYEHAFEKTQASTNPQMPITVAHSQNTVSAGVTYRY